MITFFTTARSAEEAVSLRARHPHAVYAAGSTDVGVEIYKGIADIEGMIDISRIPGMRDIDTDHHTIGALTTFTDIAQSKSDTPEITLLRQMARRVAGPQIRNRGTLGGNIANANPAADSLPVLAVLNAKLHLLDENGCREVTLDEYLRSRKAKTESALITAITYETLPEGALTAFTKVGRREDLSISRINGCAGIVVKDGVITWARVSLGAVSPVTGRFPETEKALIGSPCCEETFLLAGKAAFREAEAFIGGRASAGYKLPVIRDLVPELLRSCLEGGGAK